MARYLALLASLCVAAQALALSPRLPLAGGSVVALPTPMAPGGEVDFGALKSMLEWHVECGTAGIVALGTTGEASTIHGDERASVLRACVDVCGGKIPVIVGTGCIDTRATIALGLEAAELGCDGHLVVTPYYVKPPPAGLLAHYRAVADAVDLPMLLYNVPGRTGVDMLPETVAALALHDRIVGVKEASGDAARAALLRKLCGEDFLLYSGDDATSLDFCLKGGDGVISVTAAVAPREMQAMIEAASLDVDTARVIDASLAGLHRDLFVQANPIPVKWALQRAGRIPSGIRLPLVGLDAAYHSLLEDAMRAADVAIP
ncbi:hypothetical protein M885DRAFT_547279 [Pelagophyceae sp. CCMP2097]|nr:hypothetical protein M885DRAFT_547279 [Pelagophyceae sp. CCMP2097]